MELKKNVHSWQVYNIYRGLKIILRARLKMQFARPEDILLEVKRLEKIPNIIIMKRNVRIRD